MRITIDINGDEVNVTKIEHDEQDIVKEFIKSGPSKYARFFDDACAGWSKNPQNSLMFLQQQECYANQLLRARGYMLLNEVYRMLGIPETIDGMVAGWIYDVINSPVIDFGFRVNEDFMNGFCNTTLCDFNVQYDDIREHF